MQRQCKERKLNWMRISPVPGQGLTFRTHYFDENHEKKMVDLQMIPHNPEASAIHLGVLEASFLKILRSFG